MMCEIKLYQVSEQRRLCKSWGCLVFSPQLSILLVTGDIYDLWRFKLCASIIGGPYKADVPEVAVPEVEVLLEAVPGVHSVFKRRIRRQLNSGLTEPDQA